MDVGSLCSFFLYFPFLCILIFFFFFFAIFEDANSLQYVVS